MTSDEIVRLSKAHTIFEWSAQEAVDPIPVARAKGVYFWTPDGRRFLDFNSQLMCVNIGHGDTRVVEAMKRQLDVLPYASPFVATEARARLGAKLAAIAPGDIDTFFFTNGGADANENAMKIARWVTGRQKIVAFYRSYHGATAGAISATGDPRRWSEPQVPGIVHVLNPFHGLGRPIDSAADALAYLDEVIRLEGPNTIAGLLLEPVVGTNGVLVPPDGYLEGVRALCDRFGILMIADEVMSGFGRTGAWFAVNHWNVVPDLLTMAKGLTSAYAPLGAVGLRRPVASFFGTNVFRGGLTYNSHPLGCAAALAAIDVIEQDGLVARARAMGTRLAARLQQLAASHASVGAIRSIGLFGIVELVRDRATMEPLAPFGGTSAEMTAFSRHLRDEGLYTFVRWHSFFTNPPLIVTETELDDGFAMIDRALSHVEAKTPGVFR
ncbi:MAG TPA: aminotransferase class III-fold pyridoxal phosphate-dependent enzyme [Vicinamibacterales bacterium]|nr:aminotransferase class III-fold pyridoxal phosphate-dependent enzyme [Vicinamibacterales bacterium]